MNIDIFQTRFKLQSRRLSKREVSEPHNSKVNVSYVEMVLVIDNGVYKRKRSDLNLVHGFCKDIGNYVNLVSDSH